MRPIDLQSLPNFGRFDDKLVRFGTEYMFSQIDGAGFPKKQGLHSHLVRSTEYSHGDAYKRNP